MAHHRTASSIIGGANPHAVSLKVLRLSRPSLAPQTPLPQTHFGNGLDISPKASLAYPSAREGSSFPLTPLLTLPAAFGAAYVGETFVCTLCVNNEVQPHAGDERGVNGVKIVAELQTPGNQTGTTLELEKAKEDGSEDGNSKGDDDEDKGEGEGELAAGDTMQRTLRYELKEEGAHVLAVTVTYTETKRRGEGDAATGGRVRSFRKLYQFVSQQLIAVRSKVTERKLRSKHDDGARQWILEAQLENVGEASAVIEDVRLLERAGITSRALNGAGDAREPVVLKPQDVEQVMFLLEEESKAEDMVGQRVPLAQLVVDWRCAMGEHGNLTTGWLASRGR
jgi:trafficking protein particle complex subunit 13